MKSVKFTILGSPQSKANSRRLVRFGNRTAFIKSKSAMEYLSGFNAQCPQLSSPMEDDVAVTMTIYYSSRRPDLDESIILDAMQGRIYLNDRQVKRKEITWGLDKNNPRAEIEVRPWTVK